MKSIIAILALVALYWPATAIAGEQRVHLSVPGMFCASCPFVVQAAIGEVDGVVAIETDLDTRTAFVIFDDDRTSLDAITAATRAAGYESALLPAKPGP